MLHPSQIVKNAYHQIKPTATKPFPSNKVISKPINWNASPWFNSYEYFYKNLIKPTNWNASPNFQFFSNQTKPPKGPLFYISPNSSTTLDTISLLNLLPRIRIWSPCFAQVSQCILRRQSISAATLLLPRSNPSLLVSCPNYSIHIAENERIPHWLHVDILLTERIQNRVIQKRSIYKLVLLAVSLQLKPPFKYCFTPSTADISPFWSQWSSLRHRFEF